MLKVCTSKEEKKNQLQQQQQQQMKVFIIINWMANAERGRNLQLNGLMFTMWNQRF